MITEITKPANKNELIKAVNQKNWKFLESIEIVNRDDLRELNSYFATFLTRGKKLCLAVIERA